MKGPQKQSSLSTLLYYDLGSYHRAITTSSADAQTWFDRGLIWIYGFNHEEAAKCFEKAVAADEGCAMAYWGLAYALGPNYNKPRDAFDEEEKTTNLKRTHDAARKAKTLAVAASPVERALVTALQSRYPQKMPTTDFSLWNKQYAKAMEPVYKDFSEDVDVATLYADALMNLTPWALWDRRTGEPTPGSRVLEAKEVLEHALSGEAGLRHPGLLHCYIHLMEMSSTPEKALTIADRLPALVPDAGHLLHMPSHLDIMCGDYRQAIASNTAAILADEKFVTREGPLNFYSLYRTHNYHFRIYAAMFSGQSKIALESVAQIETSFPEELLRIKSPPMADWLEGILSMRVHVFIRFGRWQDLIDLELPKDQELYCVTTAMAHYGKGVAFAATGRLAYRQGNIELAFEELRRSISLDDELPYDEPWGWMQPTRHTYGALLLEQGRVEESSAVYSADLGMDNTIPRALQHPNNVWALHGYHECLMKLGRSAEARILGPQLRLALAVADVPIKSSCFCRLDTSS
ncbi:TPR domain protein [Stipitochalara longipes BDJ]|nr:TPR domain protein [Stipitochalara longipes BDJ]